MQITHRPRRLRKSETIRNLVGESEFRLSQLIWPVFVCEGQDSAHAIPSMPGIFRWSADLLLKEIAKAIEVGVHSFALFPALPDGKKDSHGNESLNRDGLLPTTVRRIKDRYPDVNLITDIALDPYSSDGHDGVVRKSGANKIEILNDETVEILAKMAVVQAESGADFVAPSDMMDGRVGAIRQALDQSGFTDTGIIAYSAKYASSFYGPFREALDSAPKHGDKKTYQMDFRNSREAIHEAQLDIAQGADIVMVKPALAYLDVIQKLKEQVSVPVAAYSVSGEYAMIKAAGRAGMIDGKKASFEVLQAIHRAGADIILSYSALEIAQEIAKR